MHLVDLWLPIVVSAVFVFVVSSIIHMFLPIHKGDYKKLPAEDKVMAELRNQGVTPGVYHFPKMDSPNDMKSPEYLEKFKKGPVGLLTVIPAGPTPGMAKNLIQWFLFCLLISAFAAYIGGKLIPAGADYHMVFRWTGTIAILGYSVSSLSESIWMGRPWKITMKHVCDGIVYGLVTAGSFGWLWPKAM